MGCSGSVESPTNSRTSLNAPADYPGTPDNLRRQVLKKQDRDADSLGSVRSTSRGSMGMDSGIDSAKSKTADGSRRNWQTSKEETENGDKDPLIPIPKDQVKESDTTPRPGEGHKGGVAFEVAVNENSPNSLIRKHPPKRLQSLDPIVAAPKLTAEMLAEKQKLTEERRQQELLNRAKSGKKTSRRRKELLAAKEFDNQEQSQKVLEQLDVKITSADRNREKHQAEIKNKQKQREMKAARARERARRLEEAEGDELNFDVEKDETFNAEDDVDSWLDGENNSNKMNGSATTMSTTVSERIYSGGRSSPSKRFQPLTSAEARRKALGSASVDENTNNNQWAEQTNDDFFDT